MNWHKLIVSIAVSSIDLAFVIFTSWHVYNCIYGDRAYNYIMAGVGLYFVFKQYVSTAFIRRKEIDKF